MKGAVSAQIALGDEGVARRNGREWCFPDEESLICPPGKSMSFQKKDTEIELVARPDDQLGVVGDVGDGQGLALCL